MPKLQQGTITKKSGKWLGHYSRWIRDGDGKRKRLQYAFVIGECDRMTLTNARRVLRQRLDEELNLRTGNRVAVSWFIEQRWKPLRSGTWRESTKDINQLFLNHIKRQWGDERLKDIDEVELQAWLNSLAKDYSASMVRHIRHLLKSIFADAVEQGYIVRSPARLLRLPILKSVEKPFLTPEQVQQLLTVAEGRDRLLLRLILVTALRPSELFALRWRSFQSNGTLLITESVYRNEIRPYTKTTDSESSKKLLRVFLPSILVDELKAHRNGASSDAFIFPSSNDTPISKGNYQKRVLTPLAKKAGIPHLNFQILRRTSATHLQNLGSPTDIAAIMRHTRPATSLEVYIQPVDNSVKIAVEKLADVLL